MLKDAARIATDKELERLEKKIRTVYKKAYKELNSKWKLALTDAKKAEQPFIDALANAKKSGDKALISKATKDLARIRQKNTLLNENFQRATTQLARDIANVDKTAYALANGSLNRIYALNYNYLAGQLPKAYSYGLITPQTVRNLVQKELSITKAAQWNKKIIGREVLQGIMQGESIDNIAKRFSNVLGMDENSAIRNARTAVTNAENKGRLDSYKEAQEMGIVLQKVWSCVHDAKTRDTHIACEAEGPIDIDVPFSNGLMHPADPEGEPEEVYNCRCAMGVKIIGFKDSHGVIHYVED